MLAPRNLYRFLFILLLTAGGQLLSLASPLRTFGTPGKIAAAPTSALPSSLVRPVQEFHWHDVVVTVHGHRIHPKRQRFSLDGLLPVQSLAVIHVITGTLPVPSGRHISYSFLSTPAPRGPPTV